jgi:hypothetical protein
VVEVEVGEAITITQVLMPMVGAGEVQEATQVTVVLDKAVVLMLRLVAAVEEVGVQVVVTNVMTAAPGLEELEVLGEV